MTSHTDLWELLYDWQTIITGGLAILAAMLGGTMTYWAGFIQAKATQSAAEKQLAEGRRIKDTLIKFFSPRSRNIR